MKLGRGGRISFECALHEIRIDCPARLSSPFPRPNSRTIAIFIQSSAAAIQNSSLNTTNGRAARPTGIFARSPGAAAGIIARRRRRESAARDSTEPARTKFMSNFVGGDAANQLRSRRSAREAGDHADRGRLGARQSTEIPPTCMTEFHLQKNLIAPGI